MEKEQTIEFNVIKGTEGDDTLNGTESKDEIYGEAGNDVIDGGEGGDIIHGGSGNDDLSGGDRNDDDIIYGDEGDDTISGGMGDTLYGGSGDDTIDSVKGGCLIYGGEGNDRISSGYYGDIIYGGAGDDVLSSGWLGSDLYGGDGNDKLYGGLGASRFEGGKGDDEIKYSRRGGEAWYNLGDGLDTIILSRGAEQTMNLGEGINAADFTFDFSSDANDLQVMLKGETLFKINGMLKDNNLIFKFSDGTTMDSEDIFKLSGRFYYGTKNDDVFDATGLQHSTFMYGEDGNDLLKGGKKEDEMYGGAGNDEIHGYSGEDILYGDAGNDYLNGGYGDDTLYGGAGKDQLYGSRGNDHLYGDGGSDQLYGGNGDDTLWGGTGTDYLEGGMGNDTYNVERYTWMDYINDDGGFDTLKFGVYFNAKDALVTQEDDDLVISFSTIEDKVVVQNYFSNALYKIEQVTFIDGTVWDQATLESKIQTQQLTQAMAGFTPAGAVGSVAVEEPVKGMELQLATAV